MKPGNLLSSSSDWDQNLTNTLRAAYVLYWAEQHIMDLTCGTVARKVNPVTGMQKNEGVLKHLFPYCMAFACYSV